MTKNFIAFFLSALINTTFAQGAKSFAPERADISSSRLTWIDNMIRSYVFSEQTAGNCDLMSAMVTPKASGHSDIEKKPH